MDYKGGVLRWALWIIEVVTLTALVLAMRCANYEDVFVVGAVYFTDADCYARMTRVRICLEEPGIIVRHHSFENFPTGTVPHTTAPFDYLIVVTAAALHAFRANATDLAGAIISPILGLIGAGFLWWWSRQFRFGARWAALLLYATSPILVHGTELGRPDHQSLLILLITIGFCAEWQMEFLPALGWAVLSGVVWGFALWTSFYEPLFLLVIVLFFGTLRARKKFFIGARRVELLVILSITAVALICERRIPSLPLWSRGSITANWAGTIGELRHVGVFDPIWLAWTGGFLLALPVLVWNAAARRSQISAAILAAVLATYALTVWQARWGYFLVVMLVVVLPALIAAIRRRSVASATLCICFLPVVRDWDSRIWPNESAELIRAEKRIEQVQLREAARGLRSDHPQGFLAPWWLSPAIAYWSAQPGVAGSSHEAIDGIADSARFFLAPAAGAASELLQKRNVRWVVTYDSDRMAESSAAILGVAVPADSFGRVLDRTPSRAPPFLRLVFQTQAQKVFLAENAAGK